MIKKAISVAIVCMLLSLPVCAEMKPLLGAQINWAHPLAQGLVGFWPMSENGGDKIYDLSGNGNVGTLQNMAFPSTTSSGWNPGRDGPILAFDGSDDGVEVADNAKFDFQYTNAFAVCVWFKTTTSGWWGMVTKFIPSGNYTGWLALQHATNDRLALQLINDTSPERVIDVRTAASYNDGLWHHASFIYDGSGLASGADIYVDGIIDRVTDTDNLGGNTILNNESMFIGRRNDSVFGAGFISDVRIYNRALSAAEVQQLYTDSYAMFRFPDLVTMYQQLIGRVIVVN